MLRRKLRNDGSNPVETAISPVKAARTALARAAEKAFGLALRVSGIRQSRVDLADVAEQLGEDWALFPLLHDDGSVGAMALDPASVVAFVEQQTLGRVATLEGEARKLTRTDKALAQPFASTFLSLFDEALEAAPTAFWTQGYRAEDAAQTKHLMILQLDAAEYRGFDMSAECLETGRACRVHLFLPIKERAARPGKPASKAAQPGHGSTGLKLRSAALPAQIEMTAVMCRVSMPLSDLRALEPGQVIPLPRDAARHARLEDLEGRTSLPVHLGQLHGLRAVRLAETAGGQASPHSPEVTQITDADLRREADPPLSAPTLEPEPALQKAATTASEPVQRGDELDALLEQSEP